MIQEHININTTRERFFSEYITIKKPILDIALSIINKRKVVLTKMLIKVYSQLLYYGNMHKYKDGIHDAIDWSKVFNTNTKKEICVNLNITEHLLNIYITQLRKIKILDRRTISKPFFVDIETNRELNFKFVLNGNE